MCIYYNTGCGVFIWNTGGKLASTNTQITTQSVTAATAE